MPSQRTETAPTGACPSTNDFMGPRPPDACAPSLPHQPFHPCHPPPAPPGEPQTPHQAHHHHHHHLDDDPPVCRPRSIVVFRFVGRSFVAGRRRNCWMHAAAAAAAAPVVPAAAAAASLFSRRSSASASASAMRSFTRWTKIRTYVLVRSAGSCCSRYIWQRHWSPVCGGRAQLPQRYETLCDEPISPAVDRTILRAQGTVYLSSRLQSTVRSVQNCHHRWHDEQQPVQTPEHPSSTVTSECMMPLPVRRPPSPYEHSQAKAIAPPPAPKPPSSSQAAIN